MKTAKQILSKRHYYKEEMDKVLTEEQSAALWLKAHTLLDRLLRQYADIPKKERMHPHAYIFPGAAVYLTLKEAVGQEKAYSVIENAAISRTVPLGRKLGKMMSVPVCRGLFLSMWGPMCRNMFGPERGFKNVFYPKKKGEYRMDIIACPYNRYFTELGCPELTKIFCESDDRMYGNLPDIEFIRTSTIGKGGDRCDFYIRKASKKQ